MPTTKPPYKGDGAGTRVREFSDSLKGKLRGYFPDHDSEIVDTFGHPADEFVNALIAAAHPSVARLHFLQFESTKKELRSECNDLAKVLVGVGKKLRSLSPDFDRLLGVDADPSSCADEIQRLTVYVKNASEVIKSLPVGKKLKEKQRELMTQMAIDVSRVLNAYGVSTTATVDDDGRASHAVNVLKAMFDDIGVVRSVYTWRDTLIEAKKSARDLQ